MDWPTMCIITIPVICATALGWRYMAKQEAEETARQDAANRVERVQRDHQAADVARQHAASYDAVHRDYQLLQTAQGKLAARVDDAMAAVGTAQRAHEMLEARVNRLGGGR